MDTINIVTNLRGKVNHLPDFKKEALLPVFETVVNSIEAIWERKDLDIKNGQITIRIIRERGIKPTLDQYVGEDKKKEDEEDKLPKILSFEIEDNGIGFNSDNFQSFKESDSMYKESIGGKGLGRFNWLKAFDKIEIESVYNENEGSKLRKFRFSVDGITPQFNDLTNLPQKTKVKLVGFKEEYRKLDSAYKTTNKIAQRILEHFLSFYIGEIAPSITIEDGKNVVNLDKMYEQVKANIAKEEITIKGEIFNIYHIKLFSTVKDLHNIVYCANNRDVDNSPLQNLLGTSALFDEQQKKFYYVAYVSSPYLDKKVNNHRRSFDIPPKGDFHDFDGNVIISMATIENSIVDRVKIYLVAYLAAIYQQKVQLVAEYVSKENPVLRMVPNLCPEVYEEIELNHQPEKIDEILNKYLGKAEYSIRLKGKSLLKKQPDSIRNIEKESEEIMKNLDIINKNQLTKYIIHRKLIIDLLDKQLKVNKTGKYNNEDIIHDIIFPRKSSTDIISYKDHNLWIIDENLAFHDFAVSDPTLSEISNSGSLERPDIIVFSERDEDQYARSVSIFEFKKPMRKNFDENPVSQLYAKIRALENKDIILPDGRQLHIGNSTKFYCYAICDINQKIIEFAEDGGFTKLKNELGYYTYNPRFNAHTEILHFDKIIADVKRRHKIFFMKLGLD